MLTRRRSISIAKVAVAMILTHAQAIGMVVPGVYVKNLNVPIKKMTLTLVQLKVPMYQPNISQFKQ